MKGLLELFVGILFSVFIFIFLLFDYLPAYKYSQQLIEAIDEDNFERFEELLEQGGDLDSRPYFLTLDRVNQPPLHYACSLSKYEYVVALVEAGADVNCIDKLLNRTPLMAALEWTYKENRLDVARYLVEAGADVSIVVCSYSALDFVFTRNMSKNENVEQEEFEFALYLISQGAKIENVRLGNVIFDAAKGNNVLMVKYLITEKRVNVDLVDDEYGNSVLMWAVYWNSYNVVKYLIEQGANLEITNNEGKNAYDLALENAKLYTDDKLLICQKIQELLNEKRNNN